MRSRHEAGMAMYPDLIVRKHGETYPNKTKDLTLLWAGTAMCSDMSEYMAMGGSHM